MMWLREWEPGGGGAICLWSVPLPGFPVRGSAVGCAHPFACPGLLGPGGMGRSASSGGRSGGVNHGDARTGKIAAALSNRRPRAWPLARAGHAACAGGGPAGGWDRQRICPSRIP